MSESTYIYVDVRTMKKGDGVKIRIAWGVTLSIDLDLIRDCGLGEASIEQQSEPQTCHEITFTHNASCKEQAAVLAKYFEIIARPVAPTNQVTP